jgi:hypothetical protein
MRKIIILFLGLLTIYSCSKGEETPMGTGADNIKLSAKEDFFSVESDSVIITTEGKSWWVYKISLDGNSNYDIREDDTSSENFIIDKTEFRIERIEKDITEIHIKMTKNQTATRKILDIGLESANYYDRIRITQEADTTKASTKK